MRYFPPRARVRGLAVVLVLVAVTLGPADAAGATDGYEWAALGDSYTAGDFVGDPRPGLGDPSRDGCDRTTDAYPGVVARALARRPPAKPVHLTDVSCDNAVIGDITTTRQTPVSPVQPPAGGWPPVDPQIRRAGLDAETDVVTIGVGGNSLPLGEVLLTCVERGAVGKSCRDYYAVPPAGTESVPDKLARVRNEYTRMPALVHRAAPGAEVITIGYPTILPRQGTSCDPQSLIELGAITHTDVDWYRDHVLEPLNDTIRQATSAFGDRYVDTYTSSIGHDACQPEGTKWIEGICGNADDYWPAQVPDLLLNCALIGKRATLVHPNAAGHTNTAARVEQAIRTALRRHRPGGRSPEPARPPRPSTATTTLTREALDT
ncbi:SGNH/GDSL hydrolase family protein [Embleya sp. NPDC020630]|uniref:SGNH/GDSL hydrolase family protein n=1 Tax=Embleya sp. NPDC020630 TaxID=3363979 RepID=UPI0037AF034D